MKKLFIDTNILIDLLARREPFYDEAARLFSLADRKKVLLHVSALTFANANYLLRKTLKPEEARQVLRKLKLVVQVLNLDDKVVGLSLSDNDFVDYEDALQYFTARENRMAAIITRNLKDFQHSRLPVMTAGQFLAGELLRP